MLHLIPTVDDSDPLLVRVWVDAFLRTGKTPPFLRAYVGYRTS